MKFHFIFHQTALCLAVEKGNAEIVKLLLLNENIDVNIPYIQKHIYFYVIPIIIIEFN